MVQGEPLKTGKLRGYIMRMNQNGYRILSVLLLIVWFATSLVSAGCATAKKTKQAFTEPAMIVVKGGCFQMGDTFGVGGDNEKPVHEVCVNDFYIGKYEVTQEQWKAVMGNNPSFFSSCGNNCPVENVSWDDAQDYINKLSEKTGKKYRLPTEAEWEYAARSGGKQEKWSGTSNFDELEDYAWFLDNSGKKTHPVGKKKPNGLGLYDMSGNVWEWVKDGYDQAYYKKSPKVNPRGPESGASRVRRGGGWVSVPGNVRTAIRAGDDPDVGFSYLGFRLARTP
jgi:formylglycine-generating enzyme